jgi:TolB protein
MARTIGLPGPDEIASRIQLDKVNLPPGVKDRLERLPPFLQREIAFFSYSVTGAGGETTSQEDIFAVSSLTHAIRRITDDRTLPIMKSDRDPAWSPSRASLAIHSASGDDSGTHLRLVNPSTGVVTHTLVPGCCPEWLDETTLLYLDTVDAGTDAARHDVFTVDIASLAVRRLTDVGPGAQVAGMSWHPVAGLALGIAEPGPPERSAIAVIPAAAIGAARAAGGSPVPRSAFSVVTPSAMHASSPDWSPSADRIALATWTPGAPSRVGYLDVATAAVTVVPGPDPETPALGDHGPAFSRDGRIIAFTRGYEDEWTEIWLHHIASGHNRQLTDEARTRFKGALDW